MRLLFGQRRCMTAQVFGASYAVHAYPHYPSVA